MLHEWRIDEREYRRHETRRGRRHAYERIDPARTAMVVVDMIPFFVADNTYARGIVPNITTLATSLRERGGVVAWVLPATTLPTAAVMVEFFGAEVAARYSASGGSGPLRDRLWAAFDVADEDLLVEKTSASALFPGRCALPELLDAKCIDTVLITGTVANVCCESTARDASTLGYRVVMVADANAAARDADLNATLHTVYRSFGDVRPTTDLLEMINERSSSTVAH